MNRQVIFMADFISIPLNFSFFLKLNFNSTVAIYIMVIITVIVAIIMGLIVFDFKVNLYFIIIICSIITKFII